MNRRMKSRSSHYSRSNAEDDRRALLNYANKVDIFFFEKNELRRRRRRFFGRERERDFKCFFYGDDFSGERERERDRERGKNVYRIYVFIWPSDVEMLWMYNVT